MFAVGRLGSYISRGVYTVSAPFHPFGGAVDIVVVEQPDGSFKSSPWYVRFGKFQGVLKAREKVVDITVNGDEANFQMYLDHTGEAFFLREVDSEDEESVLSPISSGEDADGQRGDRRAMKSKSCNFDADQSGPIGPINLSNGEVVGRTNSRRSRIMGLVFGRKSVKSNSFRKQGDDDADVVRADSLERAEIAADLLEVKWSTNLDSPRLRKDNVSRLSSSDVLDDTVDKDVQFSDGHTQVGSRVNDDKVIDSLDGFSKHDNDTMHLSSGVCDEVSVYAETFDETTELISKVYSQPETGMLLVKERLNEHKLVGDEICCNSVDDAKILDSKRISSNTNSSVAENYSELVTVRPLNGSAQEVKSYSESTVSSFSDSKCQVQEKKNMQDQDIMNNSQHSLESVGHSQEVMDDIDPTNRLHILPSECPDEEQFLFSDLDDVNHREVECMESSSLEQMEKFHSFKTSEVIQVVDEDFCLTYEPDSSSVNFVPESPTTDVEELSQNSQIISSQISILRGSKVSEREAGRVGQSLPNMQSHFNELDSHHVHHFVRHSLDSNCRSSKWAVIREDLSRCIKSDADKEHQLSILSLSDPTLEDARISEDLTTVPGSPAVGDQSNILEGSSGSWRIWFPFKRSRSMSASQPALNSTISLDENALESTSTNIDGEIDIPKPKVNKTKIRALTPTSQQLASLNLKEGGNTVNFTFSTAVLGKQQVEAKIYLWKWDTRIVISDVDGTITKSDVLGQFMPLVGKDWSQTGVAHLFSAIKENGYQLLFLSARAISQAYHTRQFLFNLKQDGKGLPDGPVVISPDGLFPSLFREVIRRAPHEFKIACLENIKALFPSDGNPNPFYAGFGNRDTDEFSYLKVGIPKGKIFTINPKGEITVNRRVDTGSYTSLHALVNGMFPPMSSSEQEDFNAWNYWKLPPPSVDVKIFA